VDDALLAAVRARAALHGELLPRASNALVARAEADLGFELPPFYVELLTTVANGGFGPLEWIAGIPPDGHGVFDDGVDIVSLYRDGRREPTPLRQPDRVLHLTSLVGDVVVFMDCETPDGPVLATDFFRFEPGVFYPVAPSLRAWLSAWVAGFDALDAMRPIVRHETRKNPFTGHDKRYAVRAWKSAPLDLDARRAR